MIIDILVFAVCVLVGLIYSLSLYVVGRMDERLVHLKWLKSELELEQTMELLNFVESSPFFHHRKDLIGWIFLKEKK